MLKGINNERKTQFLLHTIVVHSGGDDEGRKKKGKKGTGGMTGGQDVLRIAF